MKKKEARMRDVKVLKWIKEELERLDPDLRGKEIDDGYRTGVVLLAAVWVTGTDIEELTDFTGYPRDLITGISVRMHKSGLWEEGDLVHSDHWFHGNYYSTTAFWADVLVGLGMAAAEPDGNGDFRYWVADEKCERPAHLM
jgi:hypothetical protein